MSAAAEHDERTGLFERGSPFVFSALCALAAAALSFVYIVYYLRGGPRIVDATSYFMEGRALSEGHLAWPVVDPSTSSMGRFMVRDVEGGATHAAGIFPPGYPAVLALGFLVGAPMAVGPVLAALLVFATTDLTRRAALAVDPDAPRRAELAARAAALFSVFSAALRYHTADTMSHGLAALCLTLALTLALRLREVETTRGKIATAAALGFALGSLTATRPISGAAGLFLVVLAARRAWLDLRTLGPALAGLVPGLALLLAHQHAATGAWLSSSQSLYYATADGPAGCFRYGFGKGIGCRNEHGDFVAHNLDGGYGAYAAAATSLRRLKMHLGDALDASPLALLVAASIVRAIRVPAQRALGLGLPIFVVAYAPFYFDGNYPGGGARFFADVVPVEHAIVALALTMWGARASSRPSHWTRRFLSSGRLVALTIAAMTGGFALETRHDHAQLRDREGGRPMFEPAVTRAAGASHGLLFVDTDHGFSLGFDPDAHAPGALEVARLRGDLSDRWLWEERGRPPAYRYVYDFTGTAPAEVKVTPFEPPPSGRLEIESLWPPLAQHGGYASSVYGPCHLSRRGLAMMPNDLRDDTIEIRLALPDRIAGMRVAPRVGIHRGILLDLRIESAGAAQGADAGTTVSWTTNLSDALPAGLPRCAGWGSLMTLSPRVVPSSPGPFTLVASARRAPSIPPHPMSEDAGDPMSILDSLEGEEPSGD